MERNLHIQSPYGKALDIKNLEGEEELSRLYQYRLTLTSKDPNLAGSTGIGQPLTVSIDTKDTTRYLSGIITDFGYQSQDPDELEYHLYTCTVHPSLWYLTQRIDSRVFVDKNILDIAATLLSEMGINYQNKCQNSYRNYGHSIQYQETSYNYLNRLFEQEGIYYYFEHSAGNHTLILTDNNAQHSPIQGKATIPYHSRNIAAGTPDQAYLDTWQQTDHLSTKQININDYNYQKAKTKLTASGSTHDLGGQSTEHYDFYTNFKDPGEASHYKTVKADDYKARTQQINATGNVLTIAPGHTFTLERHPHQAANSEYLITTAHYQLQEAGFTSGNDQTYYRISFTAIPKANQYRARPETPKPKVLGTQAAIITGPAGEEVYTNEYGDIKLQFHWDRYGPMNEKSSDWIRVIQGSAGGSFGSINTPRIGEEVLVDFINGDSDRPIVVGRLYNSANPPPWGFPAAAKKSGIKSKSFNSPLSNFNELMFDDTAGTELVNFQAQKDLTSLVRHDETRTVNHDRTTTIDNDETVTVKGNRKEDVTGNETIGITGNRTENVTGNETIGITGNRSETVQANETISISGTRTETVTGTETITTGARTRTVNGSETISITASQNVSITSSKSETSNSKTESVATSRTVSAQTQQHNITTDTHSIATTYTLGAGNAISMSTQNFTISAQKFVVSVGAATLSMDSSGAIQISGTSIEIGGASNVHIGAPNVNIN